MTDDLTMNGSFTRVECRDCPWSNQSRDRRWTLNAARVHSDILAPGHRVQEVAGPSDGAL